MSTTPRSMRLQIAVFGRTNAGKSTLVNFLTGQQVSITSPVAGTTTDAVEKAMEFAPIGPVLFIDTAGFDDASILGSERLKRTMKIFERAEVAILTTTANVWGKTEKDIAEMCTKHNIKLIIAVNKCDQAAPDDGFLKELSSYSKNILCCSCNDNANREKVVNDFRKALMQALPENFLTPPPLLGDLVKAGDLAVMVVPIDLQAPKGRLILPQVQAIRDALDADAMVLAVKEDRYASVLAQLNPRPALVVCDSQVVKQVITATPPEIPCTTFSVLFSRLKGDTALFMQGCRKISTLADGDKVLIAEACTHHPTCEDIGRVKIPRLLQQFTGKKLEFTFAPGRDYPEDISSYALIVHCGSCMLNRQETLWRLECARKAGVPITNYGMTISYCQGVLDKVLVPQ